jgi:LuxR family transcriptional regulator, maltose regulon positive regulatory protein
VVIASKIEIPFFNDGLLYRHDLVGRLSQSAHKRLALVSGPAGSGKTSLVGQWISTAEIPAVWYSIDKSDNDHNVFCG